MYTDGQIITKEEHIDFAIWNNANGGKFYSEINEDGTLTIHETVVIEPTIEEQNEAIKQARAVQYAERIDPLHAQKQRKQVLGEWTEEDEEKYVKEVKILSRLIESEYPYVK